MAVTIKRIMELESVAQSMNLIAGKGGLGNTVGYVTIAEAPDFYEWVSGGEFVLSTLYAFKDYPELRGPAFTELAKRGVAGIGIKTNRFFATVPDDIIEIADQFQVPLFEITRETKFREIIQAISAELNNYQTNLLLEVDRHYKELVKTALVSGDFDQFLQGLGRRMRSSLLCFRADGKLLGSYLPSARLSPEVIMAAVEEYSRSNGGIIHYTALKGFHVFPCVMRGQPLGYLIICVREPLSEKFTLMANQLATFLTLKLIDQLEAEQKILTALLDHILFKNNLSEEELKERLALHGLRPQARYRAIVVREADGRHKQNTGASAGLTGIAGQIRSLAGEALAILRPDEAVIIAASQQPDETQLPRWLRGLAEHMAKPDCGVVIAIGPAVMSANEIQFSYHLAKRTLQAGAAFYNSGILYYGDYLARLTLLRATGTPEEEYLISRVIAPLAEQDARYNTRLLATIDALMFADDLEQAARALHVHVNTIRYRIDKVHSLTGYDFFTAAGRYVITTAYLMHCFRQRL
ncbi:MAG: PucR family transcriptional regulator ligand-binding domain-containing protein [Negativicutes bacterium]|nr:PucR family transcriptional regulator ligand-binding domain-containing protein [Negativicutes bacterium]